MTSRIKLATFLMGSALLSYSNYAFAFGPDFAGSSNHLLMNGNANAASDSSYAGSITNPAGLSDVENLTLELSGQTTFTSGLDPINYSGRSTPESGMSLDPYDTANTNNVLATNIVLAAPIYKNLVIGIAATTPQTDVLKLQAFTGNESNYLHYDDRNLRPDIYTALGYKVNEHFSLGVGAMYAAEIEGQVQISISPEDADSRMLLSVAPTFIPYLGASTNFALMSDKLKIKAGAFYQDEQSIDTSIDMDLNINFDIGGIPFAAGSSLVSYYRPATYGVGATFNISDTLEFSSAYILQAYSNYKAPILSLSGDDIDSLSSNQVESIILEDVHSLHLSATYTAIKNIKATIAYENISSALPETPTSLSLLDTDKQRITIGGSYTIFEKYTFSGGARYTKLSNKDFALSKTYGDSTDSLTSHVGGDIKTIFGGISVKF